jgi:RHS repeat-associated protein
MTIRHLGCSTESGTTRKSENHYYMWWIWLVAVILLLGQYVPAAKGQTYLQSVGSPSFSTKIPIEHGYIDASNGRLHLEIPMGSYPQRAGRQASITLMYDSNIWTNAGGSSWYPNNVAGYWGGWRIAGSQSGGTVNYTESGVGACNLVPYRTDYAKNWTWTAPDGTVKSFSGVTTDWPDQPNDCTGGNNPNSQAWADDGSGYWMAVTGYWNAVVYAPDGTIVYGGSKGPGTDSNGNYYGNPGGTDTLGRQLVSCSGSNPEICTLSNAQGDNTRAFKIYTTTINANTNFGQGTECSGTANPPCSLTVVTEVDLPDGSKYTFGYDSGTTGTHWGLLTSMVLPTMSSGQQISYSWNRYTDSQGNNYPWISTRTTPDSTTSWTYTPHVVNTCGPGQVDCQQSFTVVKPTGDTTVYTFALNGGAWKNQVQTYTGSTSGTLLSTVSDCWNFVTITNGVCQYNTTTGNPATGVQRLAESTTLPIPGSSTITKTTQYTYDSYGNITKVQENKYYTGNLPTTTDRTTSITYLNTTPYINAVIVNRPTAITVTNSSGAMVAQAIYFYDGSAPISGAVGSCAAVTGSANHDDTNYGTGNNVRGNVTKVEGFISASNFLTSTMTYDITGQLRTSTDFNNHAKSYCYADNFYTDPGDGQNPTAKTGVSPPTNAYLTALAYPTVNSVTLTENLGYFYGTGQIASTTDANNNISYAHFYEPMNRPSATKLPNGGWTRIRYSSNDTVVDNYIGITSGPPSGNSAPTCTGTSGGCRWDETQLDYFSRPVYHILESDPDSATTMATTYNNNGRVASVSNPYRGSSNGVEAPAYDGLNRTWKVTRADNSSIAYTYYGADVGTHGGASQQLCLSSTYGLGYPVLSVDEAGNKRQTWIDGFGRIIETDEPGSSGSLTVGTCYTYDLNDNLTLVTSLGLTQTQKPTYVYDMVSRLTLKTLPESGATNYYYTTSGGTLCSGDPAAVCRRTDARAITTTYFYDALNRLVSNSYNDSGPTTPTVKYGYDAVALTGCTTTPPTLTIMNGHGQRTSMCDGSGATTWSFDPLGNALTEKRTNKGVTKWISYTYNLDGAVATIQYPTDQNTTGRTVTYTEGNAQRMTAVADSNNSINYVKPGATFSPFGAVASVIHGYVSGGFAGITESYTYNNRLEVTAIQTTSSAGTPLNLSYSYASLNNGNISQQTNNATTGRTQSYTYDPLNRLLTAQAQATSPGDCWGQSFGNNATPPTLAADALANLFYTSSIKCSSPAPQFTMNTSNNNQFTGTGIGYDADGDVTQEPALSGTTYNYTYDAENRIITASGMTNGPYCYTYDGNGIRVMKAHASGGSCTGTVTVDMLYWCNTAGNTIAETDGTGSTTNSSYNEYVFFAGRRIAQSNPYLTNVYYYFVDHLGSTRAVTDKNGNPCYEVDFLPYGNENTPSGFTGACSTPPAFRYRFTGYERDFETAYGNSAGNDYAFARYYNSRLGRFMSGDPLNGHITDPQTLNHYAYVRNNPINLLDPTGMEGGGFPALDWLFGCGFAGAFGGSCGSGAGNDPGVRPPLKPSQVPPPSPKPQKRGFLSRLGQHLANLLNGHSWNYVNGTVTFSQTQNFLIIDGQYVPVGDVPDGVGVGKGVADGLGVVALSESMGREAGTLGALITLGNDPNFVDLTLLVTGFIPGPDVAVAFGTAGYDGSHFFVNQVEGPMANQAPADNINVDVGNPNGVLLTIPDPTLDNGRAF